MLNSAQKSRPHSKKSVMKNPKLHKPMMTSSALLAMSNAVPQKILL